MEFPKEWHNGVAEKSFDDLSVAPPTTSPMLQEMRRKTIDVIKRCLKPENSKGMRGDYKQLGECTLVRLYQLWFTYLLL
jgi:hypothetical protein